MPGLASINVRLGVDMKQFSSDMRNATRKVKKIGRQMQRTGQTITRSLSLPIAILGGVAVKTFADFEQSMAKVKAVSGATASEFAALEKNAMDLGASTRFTASQVAELQLNYSKLGFSAKEIVKVTEATLDLSLATGEDLARSAEVAGNTLRGFDLAVEETGRVVDVMAASFSASALDLEKFAESMKFAAPIAQALGISVEKTTALLATMADAGISGSMAGTALRMGFIKMKAAGLSLDQVLQKIIDSNFDLNVATELVGVRAATAFLVLSKGQKKIANLTTEFENSAGAAKEMAKIMDDTLQGALFKVRSALEAAGISIGKTLMPLIKKLGNFVIEVANRFKNLDDRTKKIVLAIAVMVAALGPLLTILGFMMTNVVPGLIATFKTLAITMSSIGLIPMVAIITGITIALVALGKALFGTTKSQKRFNDAQKEISENTAKERANLKVLEVALNNTNKGTRERQKLIDKINTEYGDYLPNLLTEKSSNEDISKALKDINKQLMTKIKIQAFAGKLSETLVEEDRLETLRQKQQNTLISLRKETNSQRLAREALSAATGVQLVTEKLVQAQFQKTEEDLVNVKEEIKRYTGKLSEYTAAAEAASNATGGSGGLNDSIVETEGIAQKAAAGIKALVDQMLIIKGIIGEGAEVVTKQTVKNGLDLARVVKGTPDKIGEMLDSWPTKLEFIAAKVKEMGDAAFKIANRIGGVWDSVINKRSIELDNFAQTERDRINKTIKDEEKKAAALKALDDSVAKQRRKLNRRQAIADKAAAIAAAIMNTAVAVTKMLGAAIPPLNLILAGLIGGLGAAQIGIISSTPLPALAKGGTAFAGMPHLVGEVGPELFIPNQTGTIIPNHALGGNQGGGTLKTVLVGRNMQIMLDRSNRLTERTV